MACRPSISLPPQADQPGGVGISASPGFQYGRAGNVSAGTYLQVIATVPSSTAGLQAPFSGLIKRAYVTNEAGNTFGLTIQRRTDPGPVYTAVGAELNITAAEGRKKTFLPNYVVAEDDELVILVSSGSGRNIQVGLIIEQS